MQVTLIARTGPADAGRPVGALQHRFGRDGGTVGRDPSCDLVLPDGRNIISGQHMRVAFADGRFTVTDASRNGVFVNGAAKPLGPGAVHVLTDGDRLRIGEYEIEAALAPTLDSPNLHGLSGGRPGGDAGRALSGGIIPLGPQPGGDADPLAHLVPPPAAAAVPVRAPVARARLDGDSELAGLFDDTPEGLPEDLPGPMPGRDAMGGPVLDAPPTSASPTPVPPPLAPPAFPGAPGAALPQGGADAGLIPADWLAGMSGAPAAAPGPAFPSLAFPNPTALSQALPHPAQPPPSPGVTDTMVLLQRREAARDAPRAAAAAPSGEDAELVALLWESLGVDPSRLTPEGRRRFVQQVGTGMREVADGLIGVLAMRQSIKSEFRMERTTVSQSENNLFKFTRNADELMFMSSGGGKAFLPLDRAVRAAFADIRAHEAATLQAVQLAIRSLLDRFDPLRIEKLAGAEQGRFSFGSAKAAFWSFFTRSYNELAGEADEAASRIFSAELARAYRDQAPRTDD